VLTADGGAAALDLLASRDVNVDVAVIDMSMPGMNGFELIAALRRQHPALPTLMLSLHEEEPYALRALKIGARGYLTKDNATVELVPALRRLHAGGVYMSPQVAERVLISLSGGIEVARHARLTARELEVLQRLSAGQDADTIAQDLQLPSVAIQTCRQRVQDKLGLPTLAGLVCYGRKHGLGRGRPSTAC
jgi:DNA-binding NarL/FixJ family response regulator